MAVVRRAALPSLSAEDVRASRTSRIGDLELLSLQLCASCLLRFHLPWLCGRPGKLLPTPKRRLPLAHHELQVSCKRLALQDAHALFFCATKTFASPGVSLASIFWPRQQSASRQGPIDGRDSSTRVLHGNFSQVKVQFAPRVPHGAPPRTYRLPGSTSR